MNKIDKFIRQNKNKWLKELKEYLDIPSISKPGVYGSQNIIKAASWLVNHFRKIGFHSKLLKTPYDPLVFAEWKNPKNQFTLLIYCHSDVQPIEPIELWKTPPFKTTVKNGKIFARGVSDSKGHLFAYIKGIESYLKVFGKLPINIKFIIDCDEEANEIALPWFITKNAKKLQTDAILIGAGAMVASNTPSICYGYRGLLAAEIKVKTLKQNLHSGSFGGAVLNAAECLSSILAKFKNNDGKILIPGFYDKVAFTYQHHMKNNVCAGVHCSKKEFLGITGASKILCEKKFTLDESLTCRPTFEINGISSGSAGDNFQYIIPAESSAKISFRLVPNQNPKDIFQKLKKFIIKNAPMEAKISITKVDWATPTIINKNSFFAKQLEKGLKEIFHKKAVWYREGGAVPVVADFKRINPNIFMVGFGSPNDNIHGPNEKLNLKDFLREIKFSSILVKKLGEDYSKEN